MEKLRIEKKEEMMMPTTIDPHEIILMVNYAWSRSFGRYAKNKVVIVERGWRPLNRVLLLDESIRNTMAN